MSDVEKPVRRWSAKRILPMVLASLVGLFVLIQLVPYGRHHTNPPVTSEPAWDGSRTRALVAASCFDCHSNETTWYWYTNVAPFSWLVQRDVEKGRAALNFSEWDRPQDGASEIFEALQEGGMPPRYYTLIHPSAGLSDAERQQLIEGLRAMLQTSPPIGG